MNRKQTKRLRSRREKNTDNPRLMGVKSGWAPHIWVMENFNFNEPADVFVGGGRLGRRYAMAYRRFATGAEALRFAMELQSANKLGGTVVETDEMRVGADEIRSLYQSSAYPLPRRQVS